MIRFRRRASLTAPSSVASFDAPSSLRSSVPFGVPLAVALAAALTVAGCSSTDTVETDRDGSSGATSAAAGSDAARPTIRIVTYDSFVLDPDVEAAIEAKLGVDLAISASGDGAEALAAAILTAGRPEGDVFFGVDNILLSRALSEDVFVAHDDAELANLEAIPAALRMDETNSLVPIDVGPVCVDYDAAWFAERGIEPPTDLASLAEERYAKLLVLQSPVTSTPGLVFLMATHAALGDGAEEYWRRLVDGGAQIVSGWTEAWYERYTANGGEYPLVLSYASSPPAEVFYSDGAVTEPLSKVLTETCAEQVEFAGVLRGSANEALATKVLDELLSLDYQQSLPLANFVYPARPDAELPELFERFAPRPAAAITLDPTVIDENRDRWIDQWRKIAG
ncbi:MAG: thiamine ABC transporter substrate-binding protein [Actinobacteria bacterium]|nr:thiamine ABC transporter substrate-binding protein [Actinomycetota bacterium]